MAQPAPSFEDVVTDQGFLVDSHINAALAAGFLIESSTWSPDSVRPASYILRLGARAEVAPAASASEATRRMTVVTISTDRPLELRPGDTALLYSREVLTLPPTV